LPVSPPAIDGVHVETTADPPKERVDQQTYLAGLGAGAAMLALTVLMALHAVPIARKRIVEMTEKEEREMTGRRPVRGVR
jgi:hypothetical protein